MKKVILVAAAVYGLYWYASSRFNFSDTLTYAKTHEYASWAQAAEYYVGLVYYQRAEYPKAQEALTVLVTDYSTGPYIGKGLIRLSEVAGETRDWPVARQSLERFIEEFPNDKNINIAQQRLEVIKFK